jgi:3-deoxy-manno-octulosonate cytidylyltransferase (CMP-KDO synthetase)
MESTLTAVGVIPARYASTRFPGKPLAMIAGKTMLERVWEGAKQSSLVDDILIATDDDRIAEKAHRFGATPIMTDANLPSGTDRIAAAVEEIQGYSIVVNIQGDEPLLTGDVIDDLILSLRNNPQADVATPVQTITTEEELLSSNIVKVVCNARNEALYFSRSPIPFNREQSSTSSTPLHLHADAPRTYLKHIGLYAYRTQTLQRFVELPPSFLEQTESLEQLRLMEDGATYICVPTTATFLAVDSPEDIAKVEAFLATQ